MARRRGVVSASPEVDAIGNDDENVENLDDGDDLSPLETADDAGLAGRRRRRRRPRTAPAKAATAAAATTTETLDESSSSSSSPSQQQPQPLLRTVTRPLPRVLVLHTGGTLGMDVSTSFAEAADGHVDLVAGTGGNYPAGLRPGTMLSQLLRAVPELAALANLRLAIPYNLDSSRVGPREWVKLARILDRERDAFDAFLVISGTDTMSYVASALSLMLAGFGKPVVLTGSQLPLQLPRSDARQNLVDALTCATAAHSPPPAPTRGLREVAVCFGGLLLRGNRAQKVHSQTYRAFESPTYPVLARLGVGVDWDEARLLQPHGAFSFVRFFFSSFESAPPAPTPTPHASLLSLSLSSPSPPLSSSFLFLVLRHHIPGSYTPRFELEPRVARIPIVPGADPRVIFGSLAGGDDGGPRGIILEAFGVGNFNDLEEAGLVPWIKEQRRRGVEVLLSSQCHAGELHPELYRSGRGALLAGARAGPR